ncbi:MAG: DEAD/DEAH box helicase [Chloroflexi bacterium]|nr:DEAD/DEAH box helicase [Chloroflexota bacterium]MBM3174773.1 DEAD/DEAH box helicase [Chloroflexota bacterium]MBM4450108.1 DEAD/DEAH box helicase [Chloroflexota bacterium]
MNADAFLHHLMSSPDYENQIVHVQHIPACEARFGELDKPLPPALQSRLESLGITSLYSHQAMAINFARQGKNVMVATPSASGKTMCYNLPVLEAILGSRNSRALYLFPTKALAQDQLRALKELTVPDIVGLNESATFDGDTPQLERADIKKKARLILTNPDMLHVGILPNHKSWARLFRQLKYVVIDEAHVYRGVFGSHVANVIRRLRRVCDLYGAKPQFVCCSATIANPKEHAEKLVGLPFEVVDDEGSPHGGRSFVFWNPPFTDDAKTKRRSANSEATSIFTELIRKDMRSLVFAKSRRLTELLYVYSRDKLGYPLGDQIKPYRAGYLPEDRRQIERELFNGQLLGVVTTNALELGIDIGDLEATVLVGYPGNISSTWQQAGRSGRGEDKALSFLIGQDNPLDQYFMHHPDYFFGKSFENALINAENLNILKPHLLCAAWEHPLSQRDRDSFGNAFDGAISELEKEGKLREGNSRWYLTPSIAHPAKAINIRTASGEQYVVLDASRGYEVLENVESSMVFFQLHPGAVYLHQGESYLVTELDLERHIAVVTPTTVNYYTQCKDLTDISILSTEVEKGVGRVKVCLGMVDVTTTVLGFKRKMQFTEEVIDEQYLSLPPQRFVTQSLWFELPQEVVEHIVKRELDLSGGLHAAEHAAIAMLPLFALCDRNDIGGVSTQLHVDTGKPTIFIYDAYPGGIGIAAKGFEVIRDLWRATLWAIEDCPCEEGCPSCVQSPKCGSNNEPLDKKAAILLLRGLLGI